MDTRRARADDIPRLLTLIRRYWDFEGIEGFTALRVELVLKELLAHPAERGFIWVAESQGALVGYLIVVLVLSVEHQGLTGEIDELFVLPEVRSQGTGAGLLAAAEADLLRRGCVRLQLQLATGNVRARSFYERLGFAARAGYGLLDKPLR
jgi:GNAT superfamily N-acetyltransferase